MKLFIDTGLVEEVEEIAAWGVLSGRHHQPEPARQGRRRPGRHHPPDLRPGRRPDLRRGRGHRRRGDDHRGPRARGAARPRRGEGAVLARGPAGHARAHLRRHPREHDAGVLGRPGDPHRRGGRHLRLVLHGPRRRHRGRRHGGARRDRRRAARPRGPGAGRVAAPPDARGHRRHAGLRRRRPSRRRCSSRCWCTRSPPRASTSSRPTGSRTRASPSGSQGWSRARRRAPRPLRSAARSAPAPSPGRTARPPRCGSPRSRRPG